MAFEPLPLGVTPHPLRPHDPLLPFQMCVPLPPASLCLRAGRPSGLQATPAPTVSPRGIPLILQLPTPRPPPCEAFSESTPSRHHGPSWMLGTHTHGSSFSRGQPSVHPTQALESGARPPQGASQSCSVQDCPRAQGALGLGEVAPRNSMFKGLPRGLRGFCSGAAGGQVSVPST